MGILAGLLSGFFASVQNTLVKKVPGASSGAINGFRLTCTLAVLAILVSIFDSWKLPPVPFFIVLAAALPLETIASFCYIRAFQLSPQSLVGPLFSLVAIFLVPVSFFVFGIVPSAAGWAGILLGLLGSLLLGWDIEEPEFKRKLKHVFEERGTYYILGAAIAVTGTITLAKFSFQYAPPLVYGFYVLLGVSLFYLPSALKEIPALFRTHYKSLVGMGLSNAIVNVFHYLGLSLLPPAYFISLKRSSILFDVLFGKLVHKESHFGSRLAGAALMLIAIILITVA